MLPIICNNLQKSIQIISFVLKTENFSKTKNKKIALEELTKMQINLTEMDIHLFLIKDFQNFLSEIRNSLTIVIGYIELLKTEKNLEEQNYNIKMIYNSAWKMVDLIEKMENHLFDSKI